MTRQTRFLISVLLLMGLTGGSVVVAQKKKPRIKYYQIRANETFHVRLGQTLNSGKATRLQLLSSILCTPQMESSWFRRAASSVAV